LRRSPSTKYDTEVFQVLVCQVAEDGEINAALGKAFGVLGHAELFEPVRNLLHRARQRSRGLTEFSTMAWFEPVRAGNSLCGPLK
jgi:hypothetical protein